MNKKFALGFLSILTILTTLILSNSVSAASTTLVISQTYSGGGGSTGTYLNDYVEIKNISTTTQSLGGLSLVYGSSTGQFASTATNAFALPNVTLNPGQYFLVQLSNAGSGGTALPVTPDVTTTNLSMAAASGKVALVTSAFTNNTCGATATPCALPNAAIIDLVSWGASNNAEGGTTVNNGTALTSTQGAVRKNNGCQDTDNNNADFDVVTAPVPRNTSTTTPCGSAVVNTQHVLDFNGDGKTDFTLIRNLDGTPTGQARWYININGSTTTYASDFGLAFDSFVPADYDGDNTTDIATWRPGAAGVAAFYILQSTNFTVRIDVFGQEGDDPTVVGDYDGDGKDDVAVYRAGETDTAQSTWFFRGSLNNPQGNIAYVPWGIGSDYPAPGDYDGDGKNDFVVSRDGGNNQAQFWMFRTTEGFGVIPFGYQDDSIVPGDYDGDGKTDLAVARPVGANFNWYYRSSATGVVYGPGIFGLSTDFLVPGDYDGDGKTDLAVWRATNGAGVFWVFGTTSGSFAVPFGLAGDFPAASSYVF